MAKRPYSIAGALLCALVVALTGRMLPPSVAWPSGETLGWIAVPMVGAFGIPFAWWLPRARARLLCGPSHVPYGTLLLSRFLVCLITTMCIGAALGNGVLGIWVDARYLIPGLAQTLLAVALAISAARRFRHHPMTEFVMPMPFSFRWVVRWFSLP